MLGQFRAADPQAQRHRPGHRADRVRQDDHAVLGAQRAERDHRQDHHHRGPGRVRHRRHHPVPDQPRHRPDVRRRPAGDPAAGPGHHPGRRDPRPGDGPDRRAGVADRAHGVQHAAHQRRPEHHHPSARHGRGAVPDHRDASKAILAQRLVRKICEDCRTEFEPSREHADGAEPARPRTCSGKKFYYGRAATAATTPATRAARASTS